MVARCLFFKNKQYYSLLYAMSPCDLHVKFIPICVWWSIWSNSLKYFGYMGWYKLIEMSKISLYVKTFIININDDVVYHS
jgi:hypothetical protein